DLNNNGARDPGEPGLNGWTIGLLDPITGDRVATAVTASRDTNGDGQIDPETEQGLYQFLAAPGNYKVREAHQDGWTETFPTGPTERVSVNGEGGSANGASSAPAVSNLGLVVAFVSDASNLVPGDTNGQADVFVYDRLRGELERVSVDSAGNQANGASSAP